jgi:F-type H+-transporting ATPase subunit delta
VAASRKVSGGLAARYASALYDLADEQGKLDAVANDLRVLGALANEVEDLRRILRGVVIDRDQQTAAMNAVMDDMKADPLTRQFVGVLASNRRLNALVEVSTAFLEQLAVKRGEVVAHIISARPLSNAQREKLTDALKRKAGAKVVINARVDESLIGGLVVRVGSVLFDGSLKTKLMRLQLAMKGVG